MSEQAILWIIGGSGTLVVGLLSLIWSELRGMRKDLYLLDKNQTHIETRLANIEEVVAKLPCYKEFNCPAEKHN